MLSVKITNFLNFLNQKKYLFYFFIIGICFTVYAVLLNQIKTYTKLKEDNFNYFLKSEEFANIKSFVFDNIKSPYKEYNYIVKNNDTLEKVLKKYNIDKAEINNLIGEIVKKKLTNISAGAQIQIITKEVKNSKQIISLFFPIDTITSVEIKRNKNKFDISKTVLKLNKKEIVLSNTIKNNLYSSAIKAGIEPNIIVEFANIFGFEVDFQRDIRKGDTFEIYYEQFLDDDNIVRRTGKIIYASMYVNNKEISLYNFKYNNEAGFYDVDGKSVIKTLMKTPINGARLSSSFGMRKHPILGFNKLHQGTDFAAPTGTPIMASGNGVVKMAQRYKGYGNYILLSHNSTFKTAYAHLSKFGRGIRKGVRVTQGQIIGYVGSTGMSTGPHLHYEIIKNGKKINSQRLKLPTGKILNNEARNKFEVERIKIDVRLAKLRKSN
ncbi:MAG: peptidoglycan DD-metalloendopeptidase family protein [Pelagibacteraceae bacterium]|jgi:murein DD-endopeptidase MepM/ murein hydrolase activator NlpD|nr:peptidoglycan DD-metalloendopeptidase family protein [Pelagibacteraceae bacterium]